MSAAAPTPRRRLAALAATASLVVQTADAQTHPPDDFFVALIYNDAVQQYPTMARRIRLVVHEAGKRIAQCIRGTPTFILHDDAMWHQFEDGAHSAWAFHAWLMSQGVFVDLRALITRYAPGRDLMSMTEGYERHEAWWAANHARMTPLAPKSEAKAAVAAPPPTHTHHVMAQLGSSVVDADALAREVRRADGRGNHTVDLTHVLRPVQAEEAPALSTDDMDKMVEARKKEREAERAARRAGAEALMMRLRTSEGAEGGAAARESEDMQGAAMDEMVQAAREAREARRAESRVEASMMEAAA